jgi:hypothetical protein
MSPGNRNARPPFARYKSPRLTGRKYPRRGLVDEILVYVLLVLLGDGIRFSSPGLARIRLGTGQQHAVGPVTILRFRVRKKSRRELSRRHYRSDAGLTDRIGCDRLRGCAVNFQRCPDATRGVL